MEQFVPVRPWGCVDQPVVNVGRNGLRFNAKTFEVLHQAPFIQVLLDPKAGKFAIRASRETDVDSLPFYPQKDPSATQFKINSRPFVRQLRKIMDWAADETWNIIGRYSTGDDAIIYDLHTALKPSGRGGKSAERYAKNS